MANRGTDEELSSILALLRLQSSEDGLTDDDLLSAFENLLDRQPPASAPLTHLRARIGRLRSIIGGSIETSHKSRIPGGSAIHQLIERSASRTTEALMSRLAYFATELTQCLEELLDFDFGPILARIEQLQADSSAAVDAAAKADRSNARVLEATLSLDRRLEAVEAFMRDRQFTPWFSELDFGEAFRGSRDDLLLRYSDVADIIAATCGPVLDLGCGRGELVELLTVREVAVKGVEVNAELVTFCQSVGLDVTLNDAASALAAVPDGSLGAVALIQVVEHLTGQQLVDLLPLLASKLRPGGMAVVETVNALSPYVFTQSFYLDPTHGNPVHPAYLEFLFSKAGFSHLELTWRSLVPQEARLSALPSSGSQSYDAFNVRLEQLNEFLFPPQDYALIATR